MPMKLPDWAISELAIFSGGVGEYRQIASDGARGSDGGAGFAGRGVDGSAIDRAGGRSVGGRSVGGRTCGGRIRDGRSEEGAGAEKRRGGQAAEGFGVGSFEGIGDADEQDSRLLGLAFGLDAEPSRLAVAEQIQRDAVGAARAQERTVVTAVIDGDVLDFLPEWRAAGLILVECEDHAHGSGGSAGDGSAEPDQVRDQEAIFGAGAASQNGGRAKNDSAAAQMGNDRVTRSRPSGHGFFLAIVCGGQLHSKRGSGSPDNADRTEAIPSRSKVRGGNRCPQAKWHKIKPSFTPYWRDAKLGILNKFISPRSPRRRSRQLKAERRACRIHRRYLGRQRAVVRLRDNRRDLLRAHVGCRQTRAIPFDGRLCHKVGTG